MKAAALIHAVRVAVTGKAVSPGLFDVLALLGRLACGSELPTRSTLIRFHFLIARFFSSSCKSLCAGRLRCVWQNFSDVCLNRSRTVRKTFS